MRRAVWVVTILYWAAAFTMTHLPSSHVPGVPVSDKLEHFFGYGLLGGLLFASLRLSGVRHAGMKVLVVLMLYGMADEWLQMLPFVARSCEFADWCADIAGAAVAVVIGSGLACWLGRTAREQVVEPAEVGQLG